jgi:hypothetical protein
MNKKERRGKRRGKEKRGKGKKEKLGKGHLDIFQHQSNR